MNRFLEQFRAFGVGRLMILLGIAIGVAATLAFTVFGVGAQPKDLLYSNLDLKEAGEITTALDGAGIKYESIGDGSAIKVERGKVQEVKLMLAQRGLPTSSGDAGYELFDNQNPMGQTDFTQQVNWQRAKEGELADTIRAMNGVSYARVQLVLPKRQLFEEDPTPPSASVVVGFTRQPSPEQVATVQNLLAGGVPGLKPDRVVVADQKTGVTLAGGEGEGAAGALAASRRAQAESQMEKKVKALVEGIVGPGNARVSVSADIDLASVTRLQEEYNPDGQVLRSTATSEEKTTEGGGGVGGEVSAAENLPGGDAGATTTTTAAGSTKTTEDNAFEISKTVTNTVVAPGAIKKISVSVAVNHAMSPGAQGKAPTYAARPAAEMQQIEQLVQAAVGFDEERGDKVTVTNVRFQADPFSAGGTEGKAGLLDGFGKSDMMRGGELLVLLIVALMTIFFVARPMLKGLGGGAGGGGVSQMPMMAGAGGPQALSSGSAGAQAIEGGGQSPLQIALAGAGQDEARIDIAKIEGQVKASAVKQVSEFVERHPDESVSILRSWLHEA